MSKEKKNQLVIEYTIKFNNMLKPDLLTIKD